MQDYLVILATTLFPFLLLVIVIPHRKEYMRSVL